MKVYQFCQIQRLRDIRWTTIPNNVIDGIQERRITPILIESKLQSSVPRKRYQSYLEVAWANWQPLDNPYHVILGLIKICTV